MAHLPVIANVTRCALNWTHSDGQIATNVIHILGPGGGYTDAQLRAGLDAAMDAAQWGSASVNATVSDLALTPLDGSSATTHSPPATPSKWTGGNPDPFSPATAVIVKLQTGFRGRSKRGRIFVPFTSTTVLTDGAVESATATNMATAWQDFQDDLNAGTPSFTMVVASYKLASEEVVIPPISVELVAATQRRRQGRLRGA